MLYDTIPTIVTITQAQYDALDPADKTNDTIYFITDVNGTGDKFQPAIYSGEEREIGVWTNGKPLYEKTLEVNGTFNLSNNAWTDIISIPNIDIISELSYYFSGISEIGMTDGRLRWSYSYSTEYLRAAASTGTTITNPIITIRYTKTTDTAGSGTWTPQGVPAVHYSTDEQIVGTWIDGSTLYEKTLKIEPVALSNGSTIAHGISNLNIVVSSDMVMHRNNGEFVLPYTSQYNKTSNFIITSTDLSFVSSDTWGSSDYINLYVTLRYTKSST